MWQPRGVRLSPIAAKPPELQMRLDAPAEDLGPTQLADIDASLVEGL